MVIIVTQNADFLVMRLKHFCLLTNPYKPGILWDRGKQYSGRYNAVECGLSSVVLLFAYSNFIEK